jgi:uridylate kinase
MSTSVKVISLGGSIVAPEWVDTQFLSSLYTTITDYLNTHQDSQLIMVVGGGAPARLYQKAYRTVVDAPDADEQDWIGIAATHLNGQLLKALFAPIVHPTVVTDPGKTAAFTERVMIAAGWEPGFSTDFDAVLLAERFRADTVINLSNIPKVYTADPRKDENAQPIDTMSWAEFRELIGDEWSPGINVPFDPVATKKASELGLRVVVADGKNIENLEKILEDAPFEGTIIGPQ